MRPKAEERRRSRVAQEFSSEVVLVQSSRGLSEITEELVEAVEPLP